MACSTVGILNLTHVRRATGTADESLAQYVYNTFGYDALDNQVIRTDGGGRTWTTEYDTRRLVTRVTDPLGHFIRHQYDENGNRTHTWDAKSQQTTFLYDNRDRLSRITDPVGFTYDATNRLTQVRDSLNQPEVLPKFGLAYQVVSQSEMGCNESAFEGRFSWKPNRQSESCWTACQTTAPGGHHSIIHKTRSPRHLGVDGSPGPASSLDPRRAEDPPLGTGLRSADGGRHKSGSYYRGGRERHRAL